MKTPHLNRSLTLENPMSTTDGAGGLVINWQVLGILWGHLKALSGTENAVDALSVSQMMYRIIVRSAREGSPRRPKPGQRFKIGARKFNIESVQDLDTHARYLSCIVREEVST